MREQVGRLPSLQEARDVSSFSSPRNWMVNGAVRHALQTSVEALIDIAFHVVAKRLNTAPNDA